ncbi:hypothetical protein HK102_014054, partial [Quaeritorhiza haematococci]
DDVGLRKDISLIELIGNFQETAQNYARKLIDELHLKKGGNSGSQQALIAGQQQQQQQQEGSNVVAVGQDGNGGILEPAFADSWTAVMDGIVYQFAVNYEESTQDDIDNAHCRTSQELQAIDMVNTCGANLHTALMCLVDYKGFRVICYADMALEDDAPRGIGSESGAAYLVQDLQNEECPRVDEGAMEKLAVAGMTLNLKPHAVMLSDDRRVLVHTAAGVEVHYDPENRFHYATNLCEIFPMDHCAKEDPPTPSRSTTTTVSPSSPSHAVTSTNSNNPISSSSSPSPRRRIRPEFLVHYPHSLCSDAFTAWSACVRRERDANDAESARASKYLRGTWIPAFVKRLDEIELRIVDSRALVTEMHRAGINMRYLGLIAKLSNLPPIREVCCIDMIARAFKCLFRARMRGAMLHFRVVGATQVEEEMKTYATNMFNMVLGSGDKVQKFWLEKLQIEVLRKFEYQMDSMQFASLQRPALFLAMQYQCGVVFEDILEYNFNMPNPLTKNRFVSFSPRVKHVGGKTPRRLSHDPPLPGVLTKPHPTDINGTNDTEHLSLQQLLPADEILAFHLARHFKSLGAKSKLQRSEASARALIEVAAHYNTTGRYEEARAYASSACNATRRDSCLYGFAQAQLMEALSGLQAAGNGHPDTSLLTLYRKGLAVVEYNWGVDHPLTMALHDRMCAVYLRTKRQQQALEYHEKSLGIAMKALGKHHVVTAGYLVKSGIILSSLRQTDEAIQRLSEAMHIYQGLGSDGTLIAEVHFHMAEALAERGDLDGAMNQGQRCRKLRERLLGQQEPRTIETYRLLARLALAPYKDYRGVVTPQIRAAYKEAISCLEKVFRYLKTSRLGGGVLGVGGGGSHSRAPSINARFSAPAIKVSNNNKGGGLLLSSGGIAPPIAGPYLSPPFSPVPPMPRNLLHKLTRQIVRLKLELLEQPKHKECVRMLRQQHQESTAEGGAGAFGAEEARQVILRLAAVSPSTFLDDLLTRIDEDDESAVEELGIVLQLTETETVGVSS